MEQTGSSLQSDHVTVFRRHIALYPTAWVQLVLSISHIPWHSVKTWSSFCTETSMLSPFPPPLPGWPEDVPKSKGLPHHAQIPRNVFLRGGGVFLKVVFLFSIPLFCPCARLVLKVLRSSQKELLGNSLFCLQKFIACIKLLYAILLSCLCQYTPTVYEICFSFSFSLPPPSLRVSYFSFSAATCTVVCSFLIFTYCLPRLRATEILVLFINYLKNCSQINMSVDQ